jgi:hypothetical protein
LKPMMDALCTRRSEAGCMESIEAALEVVNEKDKAYIEKIVLDYGHVPVPLLSQVGKSFPFS